MKKIIILVISLLFLILPVSWATGVDSEPETIPVTILTSSTVPTRPHRAPVYVPIQAYLWAESSTVSAIFLQVIGVVDILITNCTTGSIVNRHIDSSLGMVEIPFVCESGVYQITFLLSNGTGYIGEFVF